MALLFAVFLLTLQCLADQVPYYHNAKYNKGDFGRYVTQTFVSAPEVTSVPIINFMKPFDNCDDGSFVFLAARGEPLGSALLILDVSGSPIWASTKNYGTMYNLQAQLYKGQQYLTFWSGNDAVGGHGVGEYHMLDQTYTEQYKIKADNDLLADLHSFTITTEDTALITIYERVLVDISDKQPGRAAWIWDSLFQELDIETGKAIFEWRASKHIPVSKSYTDVNDATVKDPWDVYHINSIEKDELGNYLVSFRLLRAILYIDGSTGDVLWQLGGMSNSFTDLSKGKATSFIGQHDAHWHDGHRFITLFDNRADWDNKYESQSRGVRVEVDLVELTAKLDMTFTDPFFKIRSDSQGSYQTLPNGNTVLGYGFNGVVSEFSSSGELLCDAYFEPASRFTTGDVQSYRNLRFNWTAWPLTQPSLALTNDSKLHMSWNGATEVDSWLLLDSDTFGENSTGGAEDSVINNRRSVKDAILVERQGFESSYQILSRDNLGQYVRVIALDEDGMPLGTSNIVDLGPPGTLVFENDSQQFLFVFGIVAMLATMLGAHLFLGRKPLLRRWKYTEVAQQEDTLERDPAPMYSWRQVPALLWHSSSHVLFRIRTWSWRRKHSHQSMDYRASVALPAMKSNSGPLADDRV